MSLIENLEWRSTEKITGEKLSEEALENILETTRLSASSYGLQPYTIQVTFINGQIFPF